jgi:heme-degrading monooxygenase HmoA
MQMNRYRISSLPVACTLAISTLLSTGACADDEPESNRSTAGAAQAASSGTAGAGGGGDEQSPFAACSKGALEADLEGDAALAGPGVDAETGKLEPGSYLVASTYLALEPAQVERALGLGGPVVESLFDMPGFVAFSTLSSRSCAALRTLTVWQSEEDMLAFVASPAHVAAMAVVSELSRGSSNTVAWDGTEQDATWERGAEFLARETSGDR